MTYTQITVERREHVEVLTLDRPDKLNAWTPTMSAELSDAIEAADADADIGALVITGSGRGFCAGADIEAVFGAQLEGDDTAARPARRRDWIELLRSTKPIVAAVNGVALGVGLTMILPCDRIVASTEARCSFRFVRMGLVPELASSHYGPLRMGWAACTDLMLSGRMIDADEALRTGLVDQLTEPDDLLDVAVERAAEYASNPAPQLRWIKELLTANVAEPDATVVQRRELERLDQAYATPEHREAVAAFMEQRPPNFRRLG
ncbi:MAG: enoyl-CoA hydratase-related protein [Actinomycetota bacterium]